MILCNMNNLEHIKAGIDVCTAKGWPDALRILDQSKVLGGVWGTACTLQVMDCETGEWIPCAVNGKNIYSIARLYCFIRSELEWDGPVRLAVASK